MKEYNKKVIITVLLVVGVLLAISLIPITFIMVLPHFAPFIIAYLFALILEPINQFIIKYGKTSRFIAINVTYVLFVGLLSLLTYFIITKITTEMIGLIKYIQKNVPNIQAWALDLNKKTQEFLELFPKEVSDHINKLFYDFIQKLANTDIISVVGNQTLTITAAIPNYFILLIIFFVSLYLIILYLPNVTDSFYKLFKNESEKKMKMVSNDLRTATIGFLQAQLILSTVTYLLSLTGLIILGVKYSYAIALFIVLVDILPIVGSGSVLVPWSIFSITSGDFVLGIGLFILFLVIVVVRKAIEPKILGERIGLGPLTTLITIWVGFKVLGIAGVFLGPLLIILYKALVKADIIKFNFKI